MKKIALAKFAFNHGANYLLQRASLQLNTCLCKPTNISIDITNKCSCKCVQCDIWKQDAASELTTEQWKEVFLNLRKWKGKFNLTIGGGEPFIRKDLVELITFCSQNDILTNVLTNGVLINEKIVSQLEYSGLNRIAVSLDGINPETNDVTRGIKGAFEKTSKAIDLLSRMKSKPLVTVLTIIMKTNLNDLPDMVKWIGKKELNGIVFQPLSANFAAKYKADWYKSNPLWPDEYDKVCSVIDELISMKKSGMPIINSISQLEDMKAYFKNPVAPPNNRKCSVGVEMFSIDQSGNVALCYQMSPIGNVTRKDPKGIWLSDEAKKIRNATKKCTMPCSILNCNYGGKLSERIIKFIKYSFKT